MRTKLAPLSLYVALQFCSALFFSLIFNVNLVYHVTVVGLTPLQVVLVGTTLETAIFLFEVPTGVLADVKSRRLSVIVGYALIGAGFLVEGSLPYFWSVALAQVIWGLGYTFTSGATQAWIADEVGEERAGEAFLRGSQAGRAGGLLAIPVSVALGALALQIPILFGGALMILLAGFLALTMTEEGFAPAPPGDRTTWALMLKTVQDARQLVRRQPILLGLLAIGLFYGLYSEGFDRLWTPHLLEDFSVPWLAGVQPVVWIGAINAISALLSLAAAEAVRRRIDTRSARPIARALALVAGVMVVALAGFGAVPAFGPAIAFLLLFRVARSISGPLQAAWFNLRIDDPRVRATIFSVSSQVDAIGQIAGGPVVGAVGNRSIRAALVLSAAILSPVVPLYVVTRRRGEREV